ncbi:MAG: right-handed parallel beta-helix repeat-containing protein [Gammaproteobacteria bacterium]|nr:right-handed parallel beta-helix repeat-containing protein [Gammaproteobacteria bacterium]
MGITKKSLSLTVYFPHKIFLLFLLFLLLFKISEASQNINIPPFPDIPSVPDVISNGSTYFVNKDIGRDSYTLEEAKNNLTPWASIQRGVSAIGPGDILIISGADSPYSEQVKIDITGSLDKWTTIKGAEGRAPVLDGFIMGNDTNFIHLSNFKLTPKTVGVYLKRGVNNFYIKDTIIDGKSRARHGLQFGTDIIDEYGVKHGYLKNVTVHHTVKYGIYIENGTENIVFDHVTSRDSLTEDGFAGRTNPSESLSPTKNLFFIDSKAYNNAGDGFDIGAGGENVFLRCQSYNNRGRQGVGFKVWGGVKNGDNIWLVNNLVFNNAYPALVIKNISDANIFMLHNTFVGNETEGKGVEVMTADSNPAPTPFEMGTPYLYMFNNLIYSKGNRPVFVFYNKKTKIIDSNCNYYVSVRKIPFCQTRDPRNKVVSELSIDSIYDNVIPKGYCGYSSVHAETDSIVDVNKAINEPRFIDLYNNNYNLKAGSPAINKGCNVGVMTDINNRKREGGKPDIGAFEYKISVNQ